MPKSVDFPTARVKLRVEGDQVRVIVSGGILREPARLGASIHTPLGQDLLRQHTADLLSAVDYDGSTDVQVGRHDEVTLTSEHWQAILNNVNAKTFDLYFTADEGVSYYSAVRQVAETIKVLDWTRKTGDVSAHFHGDQNSAAARWVAGLETDLLLSRVAEPWGAGQYLMPNAAGSDVLVHHNRAHNVIWTNHSNVDDLGYALGFLGALLKNAKGAPSLLMFPSHISAKELTDLKSTLGANDRVLYKTSHGYSMLGGDESIETRALNDGTVLAGKFSTTAEQTQQVADYLNMIFETDVYEPYVIEDDLPEVEPVAQASFSEQMLAAAQAQGRDEAYVQRLRAELELITSSGYDFGALSGVLGLSGTSYATREKSTLELLGAFDDPEDSSAR